MSTFSLSFFWWLIFFILGILTLPLTTKIFKSFYDRGYAFSKIICLMLLSYLVWFFAIIKIIPLTLTSTLFFAGLILALNLWLVKKDKGLIKQLKNYRRIFIFEELLFLAGLFLWAWIRSFQPDVNGLEKFMDYGFINAILRSRFFPPNDMWLAGYPINYYYFGHFQTALLTRLSTLPSSITYNLTLGSLCGLVLSAGFSITSNLIDWLFQQKKRRFLVIVGGLISAVLLTFGGNLQIFYHWLSHDKSLTNYWYPDATRFIVEQFGAGDNTIHEFPIYSFVVADLHGHLLDIPHILLIIALIIILARTLSSQIQRPKWWKKIIEKLAKIKLGFSYPRKIKKAILFKRVKLAFEESISILPLLLLLGLVLGITFMTNAWDYAIYLLFAGAAVLWFNYLNRKTTDALIKTSIICLWLVVISIFFTLPFQLNFKNIAQGIALVDFHSPPWMLLFLWGAPLFMSVCFLTFIQKSAKKIEEADFLVLAFLAVAWFLIFVPEVFRIKDIYAHNHQRANTMFKLTYQSFIVFRLTGGYIFVRLVTALKNRRLKKVFFLTCLAGSAILLTYPKFAVRSYYNSLKNPLGLDGTKYLSLSYPDDYQAILWLNEKIKDDPVIVEAVGESYTDYARVSANTGLPTILGWRVHEWLWRGTFDISAERTDEVSKIYTSLDINEVKNLLDKYQVKLIFVGKLEREAYPNLNEKNFNSLGKVVFSSGKTKIYQVN